MSRDVAADTALIDQLASALGPGRVLSPADIGHDAHEDLCRYPLGTAACWVRPRDEGEVVAAVRVARALRVAIVAVGRRSSYWRPLNLNRAIALDVSALSHIDEPDLEGGFAWCGAGATVRDVDAALRKRGSSLAAFPDAFGDTSIGAMVSAGFSAGLGMASATAESLVTGLRVVLGTSEVLLTGTSLTLGASAFAREGLPDPTGLFLSSDGALGIVTAVAVRALPREPMAQLSWESPRGEGCLRAAVELARSLRYPGVYDTFRVVFDDGPPDGALTKLDLVVKAALGEADLAHRVALVRGEIRRRFPEAQLRELREGLDGAPLPLRQSRTGDHWATLREGHFAGVDVVVAYPDVFRCVAETNHLTDEAWKTGARSAHHALYVSPTSMNVGVHLFWPDVDPPSVGRAHAFIGSAVERLAPLKVVPYRWGRLWGGALAHRLDPVSRDVLDRLKRVTDPDGILHPGASCFSA